MCLSSDALAFPIPELERKGLASTFKYEIAPNLTFRGDVKYVMTDTLDTFSPSFTFFEYGLDYYGPDNPFNNAFVSPELGAFLDAYYAAPGTVDVVIPNRINVDIGGRNDDTKRQTFRAVGELDGDFDAGFAEIGWELSITTAARETSFTPQAG